MKSIIFYSTFFLSFISLFAQDVYYKATSHIIFTHTQKGVLDVGLNYEFQNAQLQTTYSLSEKYFVFGTYNINNSSYTYSTWLWGDTREVNNANAGYSFGGGIQKLGRFDKRKNLQVLFGYEFQEVNSTQNFIGNSAKDDLTQKYFKVFTQFNVIKSLQKFDIGYSLKLALLRFVDYEYISYTGFNSNYQSFDKRQTLFFDPSLSLNYKLLPKKNLLLTSQIGLSAALSSFNFDFDGGGSRYYLFSPILKFGVQYKFSLQ